MGSEMCIRDSPFTLYLMQRIVMVMKKINPKDACFKGIAGTLPRSIKKKRQAKDNDFAPEKELQKYAEDLCDELGIQFIRIPDKVYQVIFGGQRVSLKDKKHIKDYIAGLPDLTLIKRSKRGKYNISHCLELKTKASTSKLRQGQKTFLHSLKHAVPRTKDEIKTEIMKFYKYGG